MAALPAAISQLTGFGAGLGAGCMATIGAQSMCTRLSPTTQAQHIRKILDETRVFIEQLEEQAPSGMVGDLTNSDDSKTIPGLKKRYSICEAEYKFFLEEISTIGWADIRNLWRMLVDLRLLVEKCYDLRTDVVNRPALISSTLKLGSGLAPTRYAKVDRELKMKLDRRKIRVLPVVSRRSGKRRLGSGCSAKE
ncbi:hypothetical protein PHLCEN_2v5436 [Hermanssonia centrifuga]|uniref:Uncharacterized protein n=1 Tax=Hermanssonia centrifuga TaxID=98765 RepID=A0A2R6P2H2_9APHY|nr:hypothetical protein PHLCEN_2v5436 [Hermanssonia centrifuga]